MQRFGIGMALAAAGFAVLAVGIAGPASASAPARMIGATVAAQPATAQPPLVQVGTRVHPHSRSRHAGGRHAGSQRRLRRHCAGSGDHIYRYPRCYGGTCFRLRHQDRRAFFYPRQHGTWWRNPGCAR